MKVNTTNQQSLRNAAIERLNRKSMERTKLGMKQVNNKVKTQGVKKFFPQPKMK